MEVMKLYLIMLLIQLDPVPVPALKSRHPPPPPRGIALPGCPTTCGGVPIPYPFGVGPTCSHNTSYDILCEDHKQQQNTTNRSSRSSAPRPFLRALNLEVTDISLTDIPSLDSGVPPQVLTVMTVPRNVCAASTSVDFGDSPYMFSSKMNVLMVEGCSGIVQLEDAAGTALSGCTSHCLNNNDSGMMMKKRPSCDNNGVGCCQGSDFSYTQGFDFYRMSVLNDSSSSSGTEYATTNCHIVAALVDRSAQAEFFGRLSSFEPVPTVLEWGGPDVQRNNFTLCDDASHHCFCLTSGRGNPYLPDGCKDDDYVPVKTPWSRRRLILGLSIGIGLPLLLIVVYLLNRLIHRMMELKQKAKYFKRNGGLLLQQEISSKEKGGEKTRIFRVSELERATHNFHKDRILGQGGQGTVYKGLMTDDEGKIKIVAIKKSKEVDETQLEQFVNEVVILSQVNHQNVVKLFGCCLETKVPLLVYEFIPNGTLYQHINYPSEDFQLSWKMRLQIAAESATALAYLHSSSYPPVYHRDIKSTNILLDAEFRAKVSDFGTSKVITIDQSHVTTCVQGTYGYLDPEYFQSNQFTEKSDVYSFGVVLVELITSKKPIRPTQAGAWISLASEFLFHYESCSMNDILDIRLVNEEEDRQDLMVVAKLARQCLEMTGKCRPSMKEVAMELDEIRSRHVQNTAQSSQTDMNQVQGSSLGVSMSFPDNNIANCFSIDVEPFITCSF